MKRKVFNAIILIIICILVSLLANHIIVYNKYIFMVYNKKLPIYSVDTNEKKISLTFDTSWGIDYTSAILDILDKYHIKATFFIIGKWADDYPDTVKEIYRKGHEIGNHSDTHANMTLVSKEKIMMEINKTDEKIFQLTGQTTSLFRCPEGEYNDLVINTVNSLGKYSIQWDVDSIDWKEGNKQLEYERVIKKAKSGSIILFHNNAKNTPENLPRIIEKLQQEGDRFVTVSDLIYKQNYHLDGSGKQIHN